MPEVAPLPPGDTLTDQEIHSYLYQAGKADECRLAELFTPPTLAALARIEPLVLENPSVICRAALETPVFSDLPYFSLPPDLKLPLPSNMADIPTYVAEYATYRDRGLLPEDGFALMEKAVGAALLGGGIDMSLWERYQKTYGNMRLGNFSLRHATMNGMRYFAAEGGDLREIERHYFEHYLTERHPTSAYRLTSHYPVRVPIYEGMSIDAVRLAQAVGVLVDLLAADPYLQADSDRIDYEVKDFLLKRTQRAHDHEVPRGVVKASIIESLTRAVLPMIIEGSRYHGSNEDAHTLARVVSTEMPLKLARLVPLGYSGTAATNGVALKGEVTVQDSARNLSVTLESQNSLKNMRAYINRHFHYPKLYKQREAQINGMEVQDMLRTGLGCPLRFKGELLSPIAALTEVLFMTYQTLEGCYASPEDTLSDHKPREARLCATTLFQKKESLRLIKPENYSKVGAVMAREAVAM